MKKVKLTNKIALGLATLTLGGILSLTLTYGQLITNNYQD